MKLKSTKLLSVLLVLSLVICFASFSAFADTSSVVVKLDGVALETYTSTQLNALNQTPLQRLYSAKDDCHPRNYYYYCAEGPDLEDVLVDALGTDLSNIVSIQVKTADNDSTTFTKAELIDDTRYYFSSPTSDGDEVKTVIATKQASGTDYSNLSTSECLRLFYGQTTSEDEVRQNYMKYVNEINLLTN